MDNIPIRITSMGPADSGKSTLFGYTVLECIEEKEKKSYWEQVQTWERRRPDWYREDRIYTYLFDRLQIERRGHLGADSERKFKGASIVPTHIEGAIGEKKYLFIDVPGHEKFISNATTGIFQAQSAVLVLEANNLEPIIDVLQEINRYRDHKDRLVKQLRRKHQFWNILLYPVLARTYRFQQLIVVISKMDLVDFDQTYFALAVEEIQPFLAEYSGLQQETISFIPTSINVKTRTDINVIRAVSHQHKMGWYHGPTVLERLAQIPPLQPSKGSLLIPVEEIYWKRLPGAPLILTGRIIRGTICRGQEVQVSPLYDPLRECYETEKLRGRVKSVRQRDQSAQLPWIGRLSLKSAKPDSSFEAGYVVGINLHPNEKEKYNPEKFNRYFRKGCIITRAGDSITSGNVLKAEVFVPIYSRQIEAGQSWLVYLYGHKKGEALVLSAHLKEETLRNEDGKDAGHVVEVELLLNFPTDYPGHDGEIDVETRDVVLRYNKSFCGGRALQLYFVESIKAILDFDQGNYPEKKSIEHPFKKLYHSQQIRYQPEILAERKNQWEIVAVTPTSNEIRLLYKTLKRIDPKPSSFTIELIPRVST